MKPQRARDHAMRVSAKRRLCAGAARDQASVWLDPHCQREVGEVSVAGRQCSVGAVGVDPPPRHALHPTPCRDPWRVQLLRGAHSRLTSNRCLSQGLTRTLSVRQHRESRGARGLQGHSGAARGAALEPRDHLRYEPSGIGVWVHPH